MTIPTAALILVLVALLGGGIALLAFVWAVGNKQFRDLDAGAYVIFDEEEPVGKMTDNTFGFTEPQKPAKKSENKN